MSDKNIFKIIVIDDNKSIHEDFIKILKAESLQSLDTLSVELFGEKEEPITLPQFEIDVASQGREGVQMIKDALKKGIHYALAFVDIRMPPGWDGIETIKRIWQIDKDIQVVICTAYSDYSWEETVAHLGKTDNLLILKKPFDNISVRQLACALTTKWQLTEEARKYTTNLKTQVANKTLSLQKSLSLIKSTFESSSDGILVLSNEGNIIDYNQKLLEMFQIPDSIIETKSKEKFLEFLREKSENSLAFAAKIEDLNQNVDEINIDVLKLKNGKIFECYSQPHKLNDQIIGHILDFRDITKRATLEEELQYQATHDALTGLSNRIKLLEGLKIAIKVSQQTRSPFAVVFIDLDRFKLVNDSLSHAVGDEILKKASLRLQAAIRAEDIVARLGGDEFVIVLMNMGSEEKITPKIKELLTLFQEPFLINNRQVTLTASIGISFYPKDGITPDLLLRNADAAMYKAKGQKGNTFYFYSPEINSATLAILEQEVELRQAVEKGQFFLTYQPQINLANEELIAVEALIRWNHPTKGILLPMDFIPLAEDIGLITTIGEWVLRKACTQNKAWQNQGLKPIHIAVNVSAAQIMQTNFVDVVAKVLKETGLKPEYLELELTENVIISSQEVIRTLNELKKLGVRIAIDDFGTGYSSLSYLHKLAIDILKIDSSFIQHINSTRDDEVIVRAVIAMAKSLNLEVIAEGVETINQLNFLKKNHCADVQGFYFSKPLTEDEIVKYLSGQETKIKIESNKEK